MLILHNYFRSSTSTRLRVALNLKNLDYRYLSYSLLKDEHRNPGFLGKNPSGLVPALELADGTVLSQSLPIIEYLDEVHPYPPLLPDDPKGRARVRALACMIACEVHPLNNLRVLRHLESLGLDGYSNADWFHHWVRTTFEPLERILEESPKTGRFCTGNHRESPISAFIRRSGTTGVSRSITHPIQQLSGYSRNSTKSPHSERLHHLNNRTQIRATPPIGCGNPPRRALL